jgi:uncharacterized PurR-regulated membrane protein YhhQ (DUF165 family)
MKANMKNLSKIIRILDIFALIALCNLVLVTFANYSLLISLSQDLFVLSNTGGRILADKSQAANDFLKLEVHTVQRAVIILFVTFAILYIVNIIIKKLTQKTSSPNLTTPTIAIVSLIATVLSQSIIGAFLASLNK